MKCYRKYKKRGSFRFRVILMTCIINFLSGICTVILVVAADHFGLLHKAVTTPVVLTLFLFGSSVFIGIVLSVLISPKYANPLNQLTDAADRIANGDYNVHIHVDDDDNTELGEMLRAFNHMAQEISGIELFRNDFINNFSHEFKTPIVSIRGFAHQLEADKLDEAQQQEYISIIVSESERLSRMAENVLLLTKLENQQIVTDKTEFDLDEQIRNCILLLQRQWESKDIHLCVDLDDIKYVFNEEMMSHIWINLFSNAIKFTPAGGSISFIMHREDDFVIVRVIDTGVGMNPEVTGRVFEKFYQGDNSHSGAGNGIGLTITKRIVTLCGGDIAVDSTPGKGTTFTVYLPYTGN